MTTMTILHRTRTERTKAPRRLLPDRALTVLNTDRGGCAVTLTTAHHYSGNITHPRQGFREMGVLIEYCTWGT